MVEEGDVVLSLTSRPGIRLPVRGESVFDGEYLSESFRKVATSLPDGAKEVSGDPNDLPSVAELILMVSPVTFSLVSP